MTYHWWYLSGAIIGLGIWLMWSAKWIDSYPTPIPTGKFWSGLGIWILGIGYTLGKLI